MRVLIIIVGVLMAGVASAAEDRDALSELDGKITKGLSLDKWDEASKVFVDALWSDYKIAHRSVNHDGPVRGIFGKMPDVRNPDEYQGVYTGGKDGNRPFLSISKTDDGRFFVDLEGHRIPAVYRNGSIIFTTGDIVYSELPTFGAKAYCTLEMYMVLRTDGKFYFASPGTRPEEWMELLRSDPKK